MKTLRKMKKGFTIVELVIVIAVIAVLTAILVPTFISISNKANEASDKSLVKNLNTALRVEEAEHGKNKTFHGAVVDVDAYGYKLSNLVTKSGEKLLWNEDNDEFVIDDGREDYKNVKYWEICSEMPADSNKHSVYAGDNWAETNSTVTVIDRGFDVGYKESIETVTYVDQNDSADTVTIRTNGGALNINAPKDTVLHYEYLENLDVTAVSTGNSYHEFGFLKSLDRFESGHFVAESSAQFEETREALLTTIGSNTSNLETLPDNQFNVPDPEEPEGTALTQAMLDEAGVLNLDDGVYYLAEDVDITPTTGKVFAKNKTITIDFNGHTITITNQYGFEFQNCDVTFTGDGYLNNNYPLAPGNLYDESYGIMAIYSNLSLKGGYFGGTCPIVIGALNGDTHLYVSGGRINGLICADSAGSGEVIFHNAGTYKLFGWLVAMGISNYSYSAAGDLTATLGEKSTLGGFEYQSIIVA